MTRVLPDPAPASTSSGPSRVVAASRCGGFSSSRRSAIGKTSLPTPSDNHKLDAYSSRVCLRRRTRPSSAVEATLSVRTACACSCTNRAPPAPTGDRPLATHPQLRSCLHLRVALRHHHRPPHLRTRRLGRAPSLAARRHSAPRARAREAVRALRARADDARLLAVPLAARPRVVPRRARERGLRRVVARRLRARRRRGRAGHETRARPPLHRPRLFLHAAVPASIARWVERVVASRGQARE